jgi:DNA-binding response OmpR family regulator
MRVLLVEDEEKIAQFIARALKEERYVVDTAGDGENALFLAETNTYDLIILDVVLPIKDGIAVCKELRKKDISCPILMLTAKDKLKDKVAGLDAGADDYLTKPFAVQEFLARVRSLTRRSGVYTATALKVGDLELDRLTHRVSRAGKDIALTSREYALLEYLMTNENQVVTRTMISEHVWNENFDSFTNIIDVYINGLRKKIDSGSADPLIHTVRGAGYCLKKLRP